MSVTYSTFDWAAAPMAHFAFPLTTSIIYVFLAVYYGNQVKANNAQKKTYSTPSWLPNVVTLHNINLILTSAIMFVGLLYESINRIQSTNSALFFVCPDASTETHTGPLYFWSYMYYLSKYYELLDTPLQLIRGKIPANFGFQIYHHALVLIMAWGWLQYTPSLWPIGMLFNTGVHVVMYFYFLLCTLGKPPSWKKRVTQFQIVQFVTSLFLFVWTSTLVYQGRDCCSYNILLLSTTFNVTLLYQFVGIAKKPNRRNDSVKEGKDVKAE